TVLNSTEDLGPWMKNSLGAKINDADANGYFDGPLVSGNVDVGGIDTDGDTLVNACDSDDDADTVLDASDNCPLVANGPAQAGVPGVGNQTNTDGDSQG